MYFNHHINWWSSCLKFLLVVIRQNLKKNANSSRKNFEADYFLKSFFKVFLFEDSPSFGLSPETTYFEEVRKSDVYIGLIGSDYGTIKDNGLSPTEEEYDEFHASNPDSFFYIQNVDKEMLKVKGSS